MLNVIAQVPPQSLPLVNLQGMDVPLDVFSYIPLVTSEKYSIVAYADDGKVLKLAIAHPDLLKDHFYQAIESISTKINRKIELSQTTGSSLHFALVNYKEKLNKKLNIGQSAVIIRPDAKQYNRPIAEYYSRASQPPLFRLGQTVVFNYLRRLPLSFGRQYHLVCIDYLPPNHYWFMTDTTHDRQLQSILPFLEDKNKIRVHLIKENERDVLDLVDYYTKKSSEINSEVSQAQQDSEALERGDVTKSRQQRYQYLEKKLQQPNQPIQETTVKQDGIAAGVIIPDLQASIVKVEDEKQGIAGVFQHLFNDYLARKKVPESHDRAESDNIPVMAPVAATNVPQAGGGSQPADAKKEEEDKEQAVPLSQNLERKEGEVVKIVGPAVAVAMPAVAASAVSAPAAPKEAGAEKKEPDPIAPETAAKDPGKVPVKVNKNVIEEDGDISKYLKTPISTLDGLKQEIKSGYIPAVVASIISYAIHEKASDIHIELFEDEVRIRYRIDGQLMEIIKLPPDIHAAIVSRIKILSHLRLDETRIPQDGRFEVVVGDDLQIDLRVSIMPTVYGEKVVMRILEKTKQVATLGDLGVVGLGYKRLLGAINKPYGIALSTGPTGSGKSTTLYAILGLIATSNVNVVTLEDPVEYEMKGVNQSQIRPRIGFTFAEGLRSVLRQDPNIIMVGEIRDSETANMAIQSALTGHLVLSTLHTNDAAGAIPRLSNMGIEPFLITSSVNVVVGQRLVRKICQKCKTEVNIPAGIREQIIRDIDDIAKISPQDHALAKPPYNFYQGVGCDACKGKGYQGRVGIFEVIVMSETIEDLTLKHSSASQIQEQAQKEGMVTMYQDGLIKVASGITTLDEVLRETTNK